MRRFDNPSISELEWIRASTNLNQYTRMTRSPKIQKTILFLAVNPKDTGRLRLDQEVRDIQRAMLGKVGNCAIHGEEHSSATCGALMVGRSGNQTVRR